MNEPSFLIRYLAMIWVSDSCECGVDSGLGEHAPVHGLLGEECSAGVCLSSHYVHITRRAHLKQSQQTVRKRVNELIGTQKKFFFSRKSV